MKTKKQYIPFKFSLTLQGPEECETLPSPEFRVPFYGQTTAFKITRINIYQGKKGEELLTKIIPIEESL